MDFFRDCRIATQFCTLLTRPPWLDTVWQERKNPSLPQYRLAKETRSLSLSKGTFSKKSFHDSIFLSKNPRSLHSQRSVKRPVEGNLPKKKSFVFKQETKSLSLNLQKKVSQKNHLSKTGFLGISRNVERYGP